MTHCLSCFFCADVYGFAVRIFFLAIAGQHLSIIRQVLVHQLLLCSSVYLKLLLWVQDIPPWIYSPGRFPPLDVSPAGRFPLRFLQHPDISPFTGGVLVFELCIAFTTVAQSITR